jgi:hypothetical protein
VVKKREGMQITKTTANPNILKYHKTSISHPLKAHTKQN